MILPIIMLAAVIGQSSQSTTINKVDPIHPTAAVKTVPEPESSEPNLEQRLSKVRRIYIDSFGEGETARQIEAMVVAELTQSKKFIVTENKERADAILRGAGVEKTSEEVHSYSDSTSIAGAAGGHSSSVSGHVVDGTGAVSGSSSGGFVSRGAAISDSSLNTETVNDARIAVRLVDRDGDVIWAAAQESKGAKYKGAVGDVAEKIAKQLLRDFEKAKRSTEVVTPKLP